MSKKIITLIIFLSIFSLFPSPTHAIQQTGGTDYATYYLGEYATNPTPETRKKVRAVLTHYHENPGLVKAQLQDKCNNSQKKVGLMLWFYPYAPDDAVAADSSRWHPSEQLKKNIQDLINVIKTQRDSKNEQCFNEIQFRFANIAAASPEKWDSWNESQYLQNKTFIFDLIKVVNEAVKDSSLQLKYDLAAEHGGMESNLTTQYVKKLWEDYTNIFGNKNTYGFSIAWYPGRIQRLSNIYQQVGVSPTEYVVDIYEYEHLGPIKQQLQEVLSDLQRIGQENMPVLIQETFFKDQQVYQEIKDVEAQGLNIRSVMQWQLPREGFYLGRGWSTTSPEYIYFGNDLPIGQLTTATCESITGWACDPDDYTQKLKIAFYTDPDFKNQIGTTTAALYDPNNTKCGDSKSHSFTFSPYTTLKDGKEHSIYAYAINVGNGAYNPLLTNSPQVIKCETPNNFLPSDLNQDGIVNIFDYNLLVQGFGTEYDIFDYNELVQNYGK